MGVPLKVRDMFSVELTYKFAGGWNSEYHRSPRRMEFEQRQEFIYPNSFLGSTRPCCCVYDNGCLHGWQNPSSKVSWHCPDLCISGSYILMLCRYTTQVRSPMMLTFCWSPHPTLLEHQVIPNIFQKENEWTNDDTLTFENGLEVVCHLKDISSWKSICATVSGASLDLKQCLSMEGDKAKKNLSEKENSLTIWS